MKPVLSTFLVAATLIFGGQAANLTPVSQATTDEAPPMTSFAQTVRDNTEAYQDLAAAEEAGYGLLHGCVSSPTGGAMGTHYVKGDLVGDGELDATTPEVLVYETSYGEPRLVAVEYVVLAEDWDANHDAPPVLMGQLFNLNGAPNRYGNPPFYELHVWAWKHNPIGTFADWNPNVSCDEYTGGEMMMHEDE